MSSQISIWALSMSLVIQFLLCFSISGLVLMVPSLADILSLHPRSRPKARLVDVRTKNSRVTFPALTFAPARLPRKGESDDTARSYPTLSQLVQPPEKDCDYTSVLDCVKCP